MVPDEAPILMARRIRSGAAEPERPAGLLPDSPHPWVQLRSVSFHPFVYDRMVSHADPKAAPGDIVAVYDKHGQIFGHGLYNPRSRIAIRVLSHEASPIDEGFWRQRIAAAVRLRRETLRLDDVTDAYRLIHAEGDGLSGLIVERYADHLVFELFSLGMYQRVGMLAEFMAEELSLRSVSEGDGDRKGRDAGRDSREGGCEKGLSHQRWKRVVRADASIEQVEGFSVTDELSTGRTSVTVREHGVRFRVDMARGHKTGFFCDQRDNRRLLATLCRDADVLDMCCYSGGFGLYAKVLGGAREVTSVDLDEQALALARDNANLNQVRIRHVHADAFPYLRQMAANQRPFDVIVLDPPKLIGSRDEFADGRQKYLDLNKLALQIMRPGGVLLTCSCSGLLSREDFVDVVRQAARITNRRAVLFNSTGSGGDHPIALDCPETSYLKALWLRVL